MNGTWVDEWIVTRSPDQSAVTVWGSIGTGMGHVRDVALADDDRGAGESRRRVALDDRRAAGDVARGVDVWIVAIVRDRLVDEPRARLQGRLDVEDRREILVLDVDRGDGGLGLIRRQGRDGRDDLALEPDHVAGEQRPVEDEVRRAEAALWHVVLGEHRENAGQGSSPSRVKPDDPGVRPTGEEQPGVGESREGEVGGVARLPGRLGRAVGADPWAAVRRRRGGGGRAVSGLAVRFGHSALLLAVVCKPTIGARLGCCGTGPYRGSAWRAVHGWCQNVALNRAGPSPTTPRPGPSDGAGAGRAPVQRGHPGNGLSVSNGGEY